MKAGKVIIVSAPSGSGKTTIIKHLLKENLNLSFSVSATSRAKRENETDGIDYYFLSEEEFKRRIDEGMFLEWEEVYSNSFYGTLKTEVEKKLSEGSNIIFDVDVVGAVNIKKYFKDQAMSVFIKPPSIEVLKQRLIDRSTDKIEVIDIRVSKAQREIKYWEDNNQYFDKIIINDELQKALFEADRIVTEFLK